MFLQIFQMQFCVLEQFDHQIADVGTEVVMLQSGERQEARTGHYMDAVR